MLFATGFCETHPLFSLATTPLQKPLCATLGFGMGNAQPVIDCPSTERRTVRKCRPTAHHQSVLQCSQPVHGATRCLAGGGARIVHAALCGRGPLEGTETALVIRKPAPSSAACQNGGGRSRRKPHTKKRTDYENRLRSVTSARPPSTLRGADQCSAQPTVRA